MISVIEGNVVMMEIGGFHALIIVEFADGKNFQILITEEEVYADVLAIVVTDVPE
jgi:hypothetical protein